MSLRRYNSLRKKKIDKIKEFQTQIKNFKRYHAQRVKKEADIAAYIKEKKIIILIKNNIRRDLLKEYYKFIKIFIIKHNEGLFKYKINDFEILLVLDKELKAFKAYRLTLKKNKILQEYLTK